MSKVQSDNETTDRRNEQMPDPKKDKRTALEKAFDRAKVTLELIANNELGANASKTEAARCIAEINEHLKSDPATAHKYRLIEA